VIDPEDEYRATSEAVGGAVVRLAASSPHRLNPLDLVAPEPGSSGAEADPLAQSIAVVLGRLELLLCAGAGPGGSPGVLDIYERATLTRRGADLRCGGDHWGRVDPRQASALAGASAYGAQPDGRRPSGETRSAAAPPHCRSRFAGPGILGAART